MLVTIARLTAAEMVKAGDTLGRLEFGWVTAIIGSDRFGQPRARSDASIGSQDRGGAA